MPHDGSAPGSNGAIQSSPSAAAIPPAKGHRTFLHVLVNTALANVVTSFLWFALTFWVYLETRSVLATGLIGGSYMLLIALFGLVFGVLVDRYRKHAVMLGSTIFTVVSFGAAGMMFLLLGEETLLDFSGIWFWVFALVVLMGAVVEQLRNIALSTTVTLLVPTERRANANGLVGAVQGLAFMVTSVFSGLAIGFLGMGGAITIALVACCAVLVHLVFLQVPEARIIHASPAGGLAELRTGITAIRATAGLLALILFTTFNNLAGGVYMALMDPYGLTIFPVQIWGLVLGVTATGFLLGGGLVAKFGLGANPIRTMLILVALGGVIGAGFTIREWWWLYAVGIWIYMMLIPAVEAAEQTVIQKVVPYPVQGRVFGFAMMFEAAAAPLTAFVVAPMAEFWVIPYMASGAGQQRWGWLLGVGEARGIALVFLLAGIISIMLACAAMLSRSYRRLSANYADPSSASAPPRTAPVS
ncbi:MFS transporter [Paeniglutamicibacter antarcticus]|uniref:MFS transporter n=1 Tax=Paeniglutamicibacter antarcticus TaxID=494023 RepID=UPI001AE434C4